MHWFILFPNEPNHFLHEQIIDFHSLIRIIKGEIHSQLAQMSRIHRMMLRYSERKAQQFLLRFPKIYWAPEEEVQTLFYAVRSESKKDFLASSVVVARWKVNSRKQLVIIREKELGNNDSDFRLLNTGSEFYLYSDPKAFYTYVENRPSTGGDDNNVNRGESDAVEEEYSKNVWLRQKLDMKYSWKHDALDHHVQWVKRELSTYCRSGIYLHSISNTSYEIMEDRSEERRVGIGWIGRL